MSQRPPSETPVNFWGEGEMAWFPQVPEIPGGHKSPQDRRAEVGGQEESGYQAEDPKGS